MRIKNSFERTKKFILYCPKCDYEKRNVYFMPLICPKCKSRLSTLSLTAYDYKIFNDFIEKNGCRAFVKKYMKRGSIVYDEVD